MLVDSHCHLDRVSLDPYGGRFSRLVDTTREAGVEHMLCVSINLEAYPKMLSLVKPHAEVSVSVGAHPSEHSGREPTVEELTALAQHSRNVAIGETGLDYHYNKGDLEWQRERFRVHIAAAKACGKPLIIHSRAARDDTIRILREEDAGVAGGVMHCFTETWEMAKQALDLGFYISFSGIVTFRNADELRSVARRVPLERILIETDSPYLAPVPHRGKPNEPKYLRHVAECIAELRRVSLADLAEITRDNFYALFSAPR
jgi:TatD DNase family protein